MQAGVKTPPGLPDETEAQVASGLQRRRTATKPIENRASSRDEARCYCDSVQQKSHAQEREPVARFDAIKQAAQETREREAGDDADADARECGADSLAKNQSHDVAALRAQSHADADFPGALEDHMRDQPVQPYNGENQGQRSKTANQI